MLAMIFIIIRDNHVTFRKQVWFWMGLGSVVHSPWGLLWGRKRNPAESLKLKSALVYGIFQNTKVEFDWTKYVIVYFLILCQLNEPVLALFTLFIMYWSKITSLLCFYHCRLQSLCLISLLAHGSPCHSHEGIYQLFSEPSQVAWMGSHQHCMKVNQGFVWGFLLLFLMLAN